MNVLSIEGGEAAVTRTAVETGLTYYDASYIHVAVTLGFTLATEDKQLARAAKEAGTPTTCLEELA